mgnify:CR=1 FL=1
MRCNWSLESCSSTRCVPGLASERDSFLYQFTTFHEDMHDEAFTWTRQTLAYPTPDFVPDGPREPYTPASGPYPGDAAIPGGAMLMGSAPDEPFLFDNEKFAHPVEVAGILAGPAYRLLGKKDLGTTEFPPIETGLVSGVVSGAGLAVFGAVAAFAAPVLERVPLWSVLAASLLAAAAMTVWLWSVHPGLAERVRGVGDMENPVRI